MLKLRIVNKLENFSPNTKISLYKYKKECTRLFNFGSLVRVGVILFVTILKEIFLLIDRELLP